MRFFTVFRFVKRFFKGCIWDIPTLEKKIYLTFDDGPTPEITNWILNLLQEYQAKATFFCIGENINKNPENFEKIINNQHSIGNHTQNHYNGWFTNSNKYLQNLVDCERAIKQYIPNYSNKLFRPPYGKITQKQTNLIQKMGYKIIMWSLVSYDFDHKFSQEKCLEITLKNCKPGAILVFHDSAKAFKNLNYVLPKTLDYLQKNNFKMEVISYNS